MNFSPVPYVRTGRPNIIFLKCFFLLIDKSNIEHLLSHAFYTLTKLTISTKVYVCRVVVFDCDD